MKQHAQLTLLASLLAVSLSIAPTGCSERESEEIDTRPLVRVGTATDDVKFTEAITVQGMIRAKNVTSIAARVPGTIDELLTDEGAMVKRGAPLFRIDRANLENAVRAAKDDLAMARAKLAQAVALDSKAKLDVERTARLLKDGAVTRDTFEKTDVAAKSHAAATDAAKATLTKAESGLSVAKKNFADSEVKAPFDGIVTKKYKNAGDFCSPGAKVFDLEDPSCYEICVSLNASQYDRVTVGRTKLEAMAKDGSQTIAVSYKSPSVNPMTRTFEIRAIMKKTDALASGMLVDCRVVFASRTNQAVPAAAVANRGGGDCVFKVVEGKVIRVPVVAGQADDGLREIISPRFSSDDMIISEGMLLVNDGDSVRTVVKQD